MPQIIVENDFQYHAIRSRIGALDAHLRAIQDLRNLAVKNRSTHKIEDEDLRDLAPLDDAFSDINWTRERLLDAAGEWDDRVEYGFSP